MALRNALNLLRNNEKQIQTSSQHHRNSRNDKTNRVTQQVNNVFSLENAEKDIFEIDKDFFNDTDILFSSFTDGERTSWDKSPNKALTSSLKPSGNSSIHTASNSRAPDNDRRKRTRTEVVQPVSQPTRTDSPTHSFGSLVKLKSFTCTFTKQASQQRKGSCSASGFEPPTKKICPSPSSVTELSPSASNDVLERELFDHDILSAFTSDETAHNTAPTHHSSCTSRNTKTTLSQSTSLSGAADTTFRKPSSHLQRSTNSSTHTSHRTTAWQTGVCVQKQQLNFVNTKVLSQMLTVSTPSSPQPALQVLSGTSTPTVCSRQPDSTPLLQTPSIHENSTRTSSTVVSPPSMFSTPQQAPTSNRVRRKFPGPAGVLPTLTLLATPSQFLTRGSHPNSEDTSGDGDLLDFSQGPWITMLQDLDMNDVYSAPLLKYTIARTLKQASRQQLRNGKVTHLRALLKSIVPACRNTSAVLKDPTGEILCTIHQSVMEEHKQELQPGAVILLRQVTVFSPAPRKHYLSITPENIVTIYPSPTTTTALQARKNICLTEVEKKFGNLARTKEDCVSNAHPRPNLQPPAPSVAVANVQPVNNRSTCRSCPRSQQNEYRVTNTQPPLESAPSVIYDHHTDRDTQQSTHQSVHSVQLCEDEFDSLMGDIGSRLDF